MPRRTSRPLVAMGLFALLGSVVGTVQTADAATAPVPGRSFTARPLTGTLVHGAKSPSGQLAQSDATLLKTRSSAPVQVTVKLDYDALATYRGGLAGLPATSPSTTGKKLDVSSDAARRYNRHAAAVERTFTTALHSSLPQATVGRRLRVVYGGVALTLPGNKISSLLRLPGVAAVQRDRLEKPLTDSSPAFIGAPTVYNQLGGSDNAGKGVIVGVLDTGAWPEHPSYTDHGNLPAPPAKADGTPRVCDFGDNPLTPAPDPFVCTNKLISGQGFLDTYDAVAGHEVYGKTARDSDGHGTHTSTTSAGGPVAKADPLGNDLGAIHGIASGASVAVYKVCGKTGCFSSDSAAAVAQAILDGVRVINFSISGGSDPFGDPVELAFLDAYNAGILVSASAGNSGPGAGTTDHHGPWVTTVAASTQTRAFQSTVTLTGVAGVSMTLVGSSITQGIATPAPVVLASAAPYADARCQKPAVAGDGFAGKIVACARGGNARVNKGFNVKAGDGAGMLLYNTTLSDTETDNHWLPAVHLEKPAGDALLAFLAANPATAASFTGGAKATGQGDVMAGFSSRGPGGDWLKPDITAPGVQILAGNTPTPDDPNLGPPGNLFQAIAGTSMSAPHVTGSAALLFALHPTWTPGQVKSALETTGVQQVVKEDGVTPADPFDFGGGRVNLNQAGDPGLTFDETAANFAASGADPVHRIDLNLPSVNAPTMPGVVTTQRVATNVTGQTVTYTASTTAPAGSRITVSPSRFSLRPGRSVRLAVRISAPKLAAGQYFGQISLDERRGTRDLHLPVAFFRQQGVVTLDQSCDPTTIGRRAGTSTCAVTVTNNSPQDAVVAARSRLDDGLSLTSVTGATQVGRRNTVAAATLVGRKLATPTIAAGAGPGGYLPLDTLTGATPTVVGDEDAINITGLPPFTFAGDTYTSLGVTSNGYTVAGGAEPADISFVPQTLPDPTRPNNVMAPFWTDLTGTGAPGILADLVTDSTSGNSWIVVEWRLNLFGGGLRTFEQWIGVNGVEDVAFAYDPTNLPADPTDPAAGLTVGAENADGSGGAQIPTAPNPPGGQTVTGDLVVTSTPGTPGGALAYSFGVRGNDPGTHDVTTELITPLVSGVTTEVDPVTVTR